tara:strand:+ start:3662 stop:5779 length:2118 start_codon:yes stop_codon:yes gene_type:complete
MVFTNEKWIAINADDLMKMDVGQDVPVEVGETGAVLDIWQVFLAIYLVGVSIMLIRLGKQFFMILRFLRSQEYKCVDGVRYLEVAGVKSPFSFFGYVVYDAAQHTTAEIQMILAHEAAHARSGHSWDILISRLMLVAQWMNPFAWLYAKKIEQNLEYMADAHATQAVKDKKVYQLAMLKMGTTNQVPALTSSFYNSLIKKRVVMLNKQSSSRNSKFKLALILPILAVFLYSFNYEERTRIKIVDGSTSGNNEVETLALSYTSSDREIKDIEDYFKEHVANVDLKIDRWRNDKGEITRCWISTRFMDSDSYVKNMAIETEDVKMQKFSFLVGEENGNVALYVNDNPSSGKYVITPEGTVFKEAMQEGTSSLKAPSVQNAPKSQVFDLEQEVQKKEAFVILIPRDASKNDLDGIIKVAKQEHNVILKYSGLKHNSAGIITAIKLEYKDENGNSGNYSMSDDSGIDNDLALYRTSSGASGFTTSGAKNMEDITRENQIREKEHEERKAQMQSRMEERQEEMEKRQTEREKEMKKRKEQAEERMARAKERAEQDIIRVRKSTYVQDSVIASNPPQSILLRNTGEGEVLYIIDGKEASKKILELLDPQSIKSLNVIKDESALAKYGQKAKNGVIEIYTKDASPSSSIVVDALNNKKVLYILNGEESTKTEVDGIDPEDIESVSVLKNESATSLYGDKGKNGVIVIATKVK